MTSALGVLLLGLTLGLRHALDPDHLAAVSTVVARHPRPARAAAVGLLWGAGHGLAVLLAGGALILAGVRLSGRWMALGEAVVGVVVAALGIELLVTLRREHAHLHVHEHDGLRHVHLHTHRDSPDHAHAHAGRRALLVGTLHGLAGSGGLAVLAAAAAGSPARGLWFLTLFGLGGAAAMALAAAGLALPLRLSARRGSRLLVGLQAAGGAAAVVIGALLALGSVLGAAG